MKFDLLSDFLKLRTASSLFGTAGNSVLFGVSAVQLEAASADLPRVNPCMCTPDAYFGCGGVHSKWTPVSMDYCNVCRQSIQPSPN